MPVPAPAEARLPRHTLVPLPSRDSLPAKHEAPPLTLRPFSPITPRALLIGSSTGGPQALTALIEKLPAAIDRAPVLITQHMPPTFTTVLAEHLSRVGGRGAHEAEHGEPVLAGGVYVAPGGRHMRVARDRDGIKIALGDDPPINFCRPSVDPLFSSAAAVWGSCGGRGMAEGEAPGVVGGMPRSVAQAGLCSAVLPLNEIAPRILRLFAGG